MSWTLLFGLVVALGLALFAALTRRNDLKRMRRSVASRDAAVRQGSDEAQLQHPVIDLSRCLGCGTCVDVCPEDGVLELVHGQAMVVNGARCVGVSACERECPVDAITVTLSNVESRDDIPALDASLEAVGSPGLFLAGEVTAHALIKTATEHGTAVADEVARRISDATRENPENGVLDLCIVGAGPAGIACALEARNHDLDFVCLEQEETLGGTVAKYPRQKLVLTQPVDLPSHGRLKKASYSKEELIHLWRKLAVEHDLPIRTGETFSGLERDDDGLYVVSTTSGPVRARFVCLALGRRGVPRRLDVPGEELTKVSYSLLDAHSYQGRRVLVVGGGDSAAETAVALAEQPGNEVTISYRKESFFRLKTANQERLDACLGDGRVRALFGSEVRAIHPGHVELACATPGHPATGTRGTAGGVATQAETHRHTTVETLPNDDVFVMAGGTPMLDLLERSGVSFDPSLRESAAPIEENGTGLVRALGWALAFTAVTLAWVLWHLDYYALPERDRTIHESHPLLRPGLGFGLWMGIASTALIVVNLAYLLRRSPGIPVRFGSLQKWMTSHIGTGVLALLCALVHSAMAPDSSPGGNALWALAILMGTGAIGRYFYAYVPRAANGRELELTEVKARLAALTDDGEWDTAHRDFTNHARTEVDALVTRRQWKGSFFGRVLALAGVQVDLRRALRSIAEAGRASGVPADRVAATVRLAREAHRTALMAAHFEDLRAVLNTWRYLHRWVAAALVLLVIVHVFYAMQYGAFVQGGAR